jgi:hypothetical protein
LGAIAGVGAAIVGAIAWAIVTVSTKHQIGLMAVAVGALVGLALRIGNGGKAFGILGAFLALFGCVLGKLFFDDCFCSGATKRWFLHDAQQRRPDKSAGSYVGRLFVRQRFVLRDCGLRGLSIFIRPQATNRAQKVFVTSRSRF